MAMLPVTGGKVVIDTGAADPADVFKDGLRFGTGVRAGYGLTLQSSTQGLVVDADGALCLVDASSDLPADVAVQNGLPLSGGFLCTSTDAVVTYLNGLPLAANGAVCV